MWCKVNIWSLDMKRFFIALAAILLVGCDLHLDSVYLGGAESGMLGDVNNGDTEAVQAYLDKGGNVNLQDEPGMTAVLIIFAAKQGRGLVQPSGLQSRRIGR